MKHLRRFIILWLLEDPELQRWLKKEISKEAREMLTRKNSTIKMELKTSLKDVVSKF